MGEQGDEDVVGAVGVFEVGAGGDAFATFAGGSGGGWGAPVVVGGPVGAQRAEDPVGVQASVGAYGDEPVQPADLAQPVQAGLGGAAGAEQDGGDLCGGEGVVFVQQLGQDLVAWTQPGGGLEQVQAR